MGDKQSHVRGSESRPAAGSANADREFQDGSNQTVGQPGRDRAGSPRAGISKSGGASKSSQASAEDVHEQGTVEGTLVKKER